MKNKYHRNRTHGIASPELQALKAVGREIKRQRTVNEVLDQDRHLQATEFMSTDITKIEERETFVHNFRKELEDGKRRYIPSKPLQFIDIFPPELVGAVHETATIDSGSDLGRIAINVRQEDSVAQPIATHVVNYLQELPN